LAMRPRILVMDEPTAGLDPRGRTELGRILGSLHERGVTIIEVTHSRFIAVRVQRVFVLDQSHLTMSGTPRQVFSYPNEGRLHEAGLGLPTALEWARRLRADGVPCTEAPLTLEELARSLAPQARKGDA
ncbi:MAG: ABC transporter, partial [Olsenella profusa]